MGSFFFAVTPTRRLAPPSPPRGGRRPARGRAQPAAWLTLLFEPEACRTWLPSPLWGGDGGGGPSAPVIPLTTSPPDAHGGSPASRSAGGRGVRRAGPRGRRSASSRPW